MANTFTQFHFQAVIAVQNRVSLINPVWEKRLYEYVAGIIRNDGHKPLIVNGMPDHIHAVFGMRPTQSFSDLMETLKSSSSKWINENQFVNGKFNWQKGYGGFSYAKSQLSALITYVENQKIHHKKKTFLEEYVEFLQKFEVDYDLKYIFHDPYNL